MTVTVSNWKGDLSYNAATLVTAKSAEHIAEVVRDTANYPAPVRVKGSHHSTTRCIENPGGTVIDISGLNRILSIDAENLSIRMQAGVHHIDAAKALEKMGLQFYVNVEIGNLTVGSGACGGTKDASYISDGQNEFGQVASYCIGMKVVQADGRLVEYTQDSELLPALRSSYGLLGIIVEVTYRVKPIRSMKVRHTVYRAEEFVARLDELLALERSMMLYLFPFLDRIVVEYRYDSDVPLRSGSWQWRLRNFVWKTVSPGFGRLVGIVVPWGHARHVIYNLWNRLTMLVMRLLLRDCNSSPADQIILYPERAGFASYTFSIWAFARESYGQALLDYFHFCRDYRHRTGYRCDLLNVGYSIAQDQQSLFSYTRRGPALTLDPVASGGEGWYEFLQAYNQFCHEHHGTPLFNQTWGLTHEQVQAAFSDEVPEFLQLRQRLDPDNRFYTAWFRELLQGSEISA